MTPRKIQAIEADNYDAVHGKAIFKGFVRAYAKVLKMDADVLVAMIPDDKPAQKKLTPTRRNVSEVFTETRMPVLGQRAGQSKLVLGAIVALVLLIAVLAMQKMGWLPSIPASLMSRVEKAPASASSAASTPEAEAPPVSNRATEDGKVKQIELPLVDVSSQLTSASVSSSPAKGASASPVPEEVAASQAAAPADSSNALVLKFREESWVELKSANGSVLVSRKIAAGVSETFEITEPVQLTLGNGPGVNATLRGASLEIPIDAYSKVVRLNLK